MFRSARSSLPALLLVATAGCLPDGAGMDQHAEGDPTATLAAEESPATQPDQADPAEEERRGTEAPSTAGGSEEASATIPDVPPTPAANPAELARRLAAAEKLVRDPQVRGDDLTAAALETQVLYRQLARQEQWRRPVISRLPPRYREPARKHLEARTSFRSMHRRLSDRVPAWKVSAPVPRQELLSHYRKAERRYGVGWEILAAVNLVETAFGRIGSDSVAGAQGPMQFIPETWARYGEGDVHDPHDAVMGAANHLAAHGAADGDVDDALYAYNNHPAYVAGVKALAAVLTEDPKAFRGLHGWQVIYLSDAGDMWLPAGYDREEPVPAKRYAAQHPERHLSSDTR